MPGQTGLSWVVCPFFRATSGLCISCEPPMPDATRVQILWCTKAAYTFHFREYCCTQTFKYCEIYQMTMAAKYEG